MKLQLPGRPASVAAQDANSALAQRLSIIVEKLGLDEESPVTSYSVFVDKLRAMPWPSSRIIVVLYQLFLARLPTQNEVTNFSKYLEHESTSDLCDRFTRSVEFFKGAQSRTRFETIESNLLAIDVTHTLEYPYNTGIQRVVRSLSKQLIVDRASVVFIRFDESHNCYRRLNDDEVKSLIDWEHRKLRKVATDPSLPEKLKPKTFKTIVKRLAGRTLSNSVSEALRAIRRFRHSRRRSDPAGAPLRRESTTVTPRSAVFLWEDGLLLPELIGEPLRLQTVALLLDSVPLHSSMIVYDLIPLLHPEYCAGIVDPFVRYLTLLRRVDRASCISEAVKDDVETILGRVVTRTTPIRVEAHLLGADFDFRQSPSLTACNDSEPTVLCVGTWEVRKNHRGILRAMVKAQQAGCRFRGVFAGNPGWLAESFFEELEFFQKRGFSIELRKSPSEAELSELYEKATCSIYCSMAEGFGLPIVESVAKGVPCITSNRGSMLELATLLGGCVVVDPASESSMAVAIESLLKDQQYYRRIKAECENAGCKTWLEYAREIYDFARPSAVRSQEIAMRSTAA